MSSARAGMAIGALTAIALALVYLRVEQTRWASRTLALELQRMTLRQELWQLQTSAARLRAPARLHDRMEWFDTDLITATPGPSGLRIADSTMEPPAR